MNQINHHYLTTFRGFHKGVSGISHSITGTDCKDNGFKVFSPLWAFFEETNKIFGNIPHLALTQEIES